jgi:hypothetical protein
MVAAISMRWQQQRQVVDSLTRAGGMRKMLRQNGSGNVVVLAADNTKSKQGMTDDSIQKHGRLMQQEQAAGSAKRMGGG